MGRLKKFILSRRIDFLIVSFFIIFILIVFALNTFLVRLSLGQTLKTELLNRGLVLAQDYSNRFTDQLLVKDLDGIIATLIDERRTHPEVYYIAITDPEASGQILATSFVGNLPDNLAEELAVEQAENNTVQIQVGDEQVYNSAVQMKYGIGTINIGFYKKQIDDTITQTLKSLGLGIIISLLAAVLLAFVFLKIILLPINALQGVVEKVTAGNYNEKIAVHTNDKIGLLAQGFNNMMDEIRRAKQALEHTNKDLEGQVAKRTQELQGKVDEMERFQTLVVNRELRMVELKNKLKDVETKNNGRA